MKYKVKVKFHKDFLKVDGNRILIGLVSPPKKGKANSELVRKIARYFKISSSHVRIIAGYKSKRKIIEVTG